MKRNLLTIFTAAFLVISPLILPAQAPPHPNGGNAPGSGNGPVGGGAPIDGGLSVLLILGAGYGASKFLSSQKQVVD
jgi:hypothetical protein